ncbi:MAG: HAD-IIIC family phosphatase [Planctomycetes bacterium]|nr:HAD-IIIC family phosphatase [Planctomycetota bacterium]
MTSGAAATQAEIRPPTRAEWRQAALTAGRAGVLERLRARGGEALEFAIFSTTTWRPLEPFLAAELLLDGVAPRLHFFEYEAMDAQIAVQQRPFDCALLAIDDERTYASLHDPARPWTEADAARLRGEFLRRVDLAAASARHLFVLEPHMPHASAYPLHVAAEGGTVRERVAAFRRKLGAELAGRTEVERLDPGAWEEEIGRAAAFDLRLWHLARLRYTEAAFAWIARDLARRILLKSGRGLKAVIVDLDNTLWGGIVGEVGAGGIALGDGYPGACYLELQAELRRWRESGILLAAASKNNRDDALAAIDGHPAMLLRSTDFAHLEIHWEEKAESVARILEAFNIGADSALYIDDSPRERAAVAAAHPALRVLDLPDEPLDFAPALRAVPWPLFAGTSAEDLRRGELQSQHAERAALLADPATRVEHLRSLAIGVRVRCDDPADLARVAQLHAKTNQFNLDPKRLTESEIQSAMNDPGAIVAAMDYCDRFGDAGMVGAAVARLGGTELRIETMLLSCRVIGLGVEVALLRALVEEAAARGAEPREVHLPYRATEKNAPARAFLEEIGALDPGGACRAVAVAALPALPEWIGCERARSGSRPPRLPPGDPTQRTELLHAD